MRPFLKLIRFPNLVIVVLTQLLLYHFVLRMAVERPHEVLVLDWTAFWAVVVGTVCSAAAGYIINDIFDQQIDMQNKPDKVIVGNKIPVSVAYRWYYALVTVVFWTSIFLFWKSGQWFWIPVFNLSTFFLYWYSQKWKREVLIGNLVVAFFCALVAMMVFAADVEILLKTNCPEDIPRNWTLIPDGVKARWMAIGYTLFAFWTTLYREIVKDLEDMEGDRAESCRTLPVVYGQANAKIIAGITGMIMMVMTIYGMRLMYPSGGVWLISTVALVCFLAFGILVPTIVSLFFLYLATEKDDFHRISSMIKKLMFIGLVGLVYASYFQM